VELSGRVATPGQVRIAERDAKSVPGVREVQNSIRPSVGGSY
jgi:osmotically-inducible protein OsmY